MSPAYSEDVRFRMTLRSERPHKMSSVQPQFGLFRVAPDSTPIRSSVRAPLTPRNYTTTTTQSFAASAGGGDTKKPRGTAHLSSTALPAMYAARGNSPRK
uniref:Uncharacterized protein n=1 Tax=Caenorhabditis japonica TaxID=281687 RepID=A0A8R1IRB3_CAEJA